MAGYQRGEAVAFEELYDRFAGDLRDFLTLLCGDRELADDLVQESFLQLHRARHTYMPRRSFRPWALAIARHVFRMECRARRRRWRHERRFPQIDWRPPAEIEGVARRDEIDEALASLSPERQEVVLLHHALGLSFDEIGAILGERAGTVKVRAHRGLKQIRERLQGRRST